MTNCTDIIFGQNVIQRNYEHVQKRELIILYLNKKFSMHLKKAW